MDFVSVSTFVLFRQDDVMVSKPHHHPAIILTLTLDASFRQNKLYRHSMHGTIQVYNTVVLKISPSP